jgi:endonuclease/exonuclease/phosphatase (EEP) superfamily protein YafD
MKNLALLTLILATSTGLAKEPGPRNPVDRYFGHIPENQAHVSWGSTTGERLPSQGLDVLVWNVKKGALPDFGAEFLKFGKDKELLLVQEAYTAPYFTTVLSWFQNYEWDMGMSFTYLLYNNEATGNMIGGDVKPAWLKIQHTVDMEPLTNTPKSTVYAKYDVEGSDSQLLVISVHGINFADKDAFAHHLAQFRAEISAHSGPVLLAGDFNTRTKERYHEVQALASSLKLKEVKLLHGELRMTAVGTKNFLDHAFVRGLTVRHAEIFSSDGSDHQPMVLSLDFP